MCPIGIGECRQRIEAKAMALATRLDVEEVCGTDQLCSRAKAGIEPAIHSMRDIFLRDGTESLLLVDASNGQPCFVIVPYCGPDVPDSYSTSIADFRSLF